MHTSRNRPSSPTVKQDWEVNMLTTNPGEAAPGSSFDLLKRATQKMLYNRYVRPSVLSTSHQPCHGGRILPVILWQEPLLSLSNPYQPSGISAPFLSRTTSITPPVTLHLLRRYTAQNCLVRLRCNLPLSKPRLFNVPPQPWFPERDPSCSRARLHTVAQVAHM